MGFLWLLEEYLSSRNSILFKILDESQLYLETFLVCIEEEKTAVRECPEKTWENILIEALWDRKGNSGKRLVV
jgi:hypothetical protein